ncbi:NF-kappa-B inhibitor zeta [Chaetodon trifascialis]|uniref:NF-kappa-B inhibitor zeta n=1 Tax=Chaetodon trifascialis TaxID=109706 RepID=UPI00399571E2
MLDPRGNETRGGQSLSIGSNVANDTGCFDPRLPKYAQAVRKNTVKELLMMKRQKWSCPQDDNNPQHKFKRTKSETFSNYTGPHLSGHPAAVNSNMKNESAPENDHATPQHPALQGQASATAEVTLFHWQIHQEARRVGGISPELLNMQDADGDTFLHIAVAQGRRALAYVLASKMAPGGSLDLKEHNGLTALQIAAATNQHLIVHDLLTHGAQINTCDLWGRSPLHVCAEKGHLLSLQSIWRTLTGSGQQINVDMFNYDGLTPLHVAVLSHNAVVKELRTLENPCSYMTNQLLQRRHTHVECVKMLLLMGASFGTEATIEIVFHFFHHFKDNSKNERQLQRLHLVSTFLSLLQDLKSGRTCLHMASEEANVELLNVFLDLPSSLSVINVQTFSGNTALHIVSSLQNHKCQVEAVKLLMRRGGDPGTRNAENELPSQLVPEGPMGEQVRRILKGKCFHA